MACSVEPPYCPAGHCRVAKHRGRGRSLPEQMQGLTQIPVKKQQLFSWIYFIEISLLFYQCQLLQRFDFAQRFERNPSTPLRAFLASLQSFDFAQGFVCDPSTSLRTL